MSTAVAGAQIAGTGSVQGTVTDTTGAAVGGANVTLTNDATQVQHTATTDKQGLYSFPNINVGTYTLMVADQGFKTYTQHNVVLEVGSSLGLNVPLTVGSTTEEVTVSASGLALQTEDASFKQTIDERTLTELPLNGRQVTSLITLAGASVPSSSLTQGNKGWWSSASPQIAGGQGNQSDYRLDGGDNNDYESNTSFALPFPDAVSQFSVQSSVQSADTGLHPAGVINVVTKSGTNAWHGNAFEFMRNTVMDATNYFATTPDSLHQNQFGGTLGGHIIKDRLFFFGGYQRLNFSEASNASTAHVPTQAMLNVTSRRRKWRRARPRDRSNCSTRSRVRCW
ncbi:MAG TPA: carboxypeptidase regulatory-like domain-containing protein [Acidobacteriaceae bacterium]|nr:carboxypeptidase regulatory-like domain-containing protein [Acidobacteriaceae bacterium]